MPLYPPQSSGGTPGGSDTDVQFNDSGSFGGESGLAYDKTTNSLKVNGGTGAGVTLEVGGTADLLYLSMQGTQTINNTRDATLNSINVDGVAGIDSSGNISGNNLSGTNTGDQDLSTYQLKPSEGAFVNGDKTKLNGIEAGADVTDTANVTSAGALMDSEVTNLAQVKAFSSADYAPALGTDDNYVTDAEKVVIGNTSGTNTGDQDLSSYATTAAVAASYQPLDSDLTTIAAASNGAVLAATTASFLTADETKLDGIEAGADVTDTANVTSAGALMDSEVDADIKTLSLPASTTISAFGATLVDDADASTARTTLGLVIGTNVQAYDADLATIAGLTPTTDNFMVGTSSAWASRTPAQARSQMGLGSLATLSTINNGNWSGTALSVANGGTGVSTLTGIAKGNGTSAFTAASAGTDYYAPSSTDVAVADGGTGRSTSTTAYGLIAAGTTATGAHQTLATGSSGQILKSNGASSLPTFQTGAKGDVGLGNVDNTADSAKNVDKVDGFDASSTPAANTLIPLDANLLTPLGIRQQSNTTNSVVSVKEQRGWGFINTPGGSNYVSETVTFPVAFTTLHGLVVSSLGQLNGSDPGSIPALTSDFNQAVAGSSIPTLTTFKVGIATNGGGNFGANERWAYSWIAWGVI